MTPLSANPLVSTAQSFLTPDLVPPYAELAFTGDSDHSQVKVARLVFSESKTFLFTVELPAETGCKV